LGSTSVKAVRKSSVKLTPGGPSIPSVGFVSQEKGITIE